MRPSANSTALIAEFNTYSIEQDASGMVPVSSPATFRRDEPVPVVTPWQTRVNCANFPIGTFELYGTKGNERTEKEQAAMRICGECVVSSECLEFNLPLRRTGDQVLFGNKTLKQIQTLSGKS